MSFLINPYSTAAGAGVGGSGLALWLAAWKETGLSNNDAMVTLTDWSGNGRDFTQATSGNRPLYQTSVLNSQPGFYFDGVNDFVEASVFLSGDCELFAVLKTADTGSSNWGAYKFDGNTLASHISFFGTIHSSFGGTNRINYIPSPGSLMTAGFVHQVTGVAGSGNFHIYENGNNDRAAGTQTISWGTNRHLVGASSNVADASSITNYYKGHFLEVLIYNTQRTTAERNAILADFNTRYGISVTNF